MRSSGDNALAELSASMEEHATTFDLSEVRGQGEMQHKLWVRAAVLKCTKLIQRKTLVWELSHALQTVLKTNAEVLRLKDENKQIGFALDVFDIERERVDGDVLACNAQFTPAGCLAIDCFSSHGKC